MDGFATFNRRFAQAFAHCNDGIFYKSRITLARMQRAALIESMFGVTTSDDYRPVAWMGRYPVDVTTMLVGVHVAAALMAALLYAIAGTVGAASLLGWLQLNSASVWSGGQVWRLFTYAFVHSPSGLLWFAIEMYLLFVFGREVERFIGRRSYIALYLILLITPAALLTMWSHWQASVLSGSWALHFGIFIAFATIYPRAELFLRIMAKWVALILAGVYTFERLAYHAWSDLVVVWTSIGAAFLFIEWSGAGPELAWWSALKTRFAPRPKYRVVPKMRPTRPADSDDVYASIDPILDKISKFGMGSLTASERRQLNRERERLLKKSE
jgi:membrane associated rhomboid family serine protease